MCAYNKWLWYILFIVLTYVNLIYGCGIHTLLWHTCFWTVTVAYAHMTRGDDMCAYDKRLWYILFTAMPYSFLIFGRGIYIFVWAVDVFFWAVESWAVAYAHTWHLAMWCVCLINGCGIGYVMRVYDKWVWCLSFEAAIYRFSMGWLTLVGSFKL